MMITVEELRSDIGYRWREDVTDQLDSLESHQLLHKDALKMEAQDELEVAYGIYRELVWRFPEDVDAWAGLVRTSGAFGRVEEAKVASEEWIRLQKAQGISSV
jgi:hypothetical protein